jgi:exonuclease SbcC
MFLEKFAIEGIGPFVKRQEIDLGALGAGVFAIRGENGSGKTMLLEGMSAATLFGEYPSRSPSKVWDYLSAKTGSVTLHFRLGGVTYGIENKFTKSGQSPRLFLVDRDGRETQSLTPSGKVGEFSEKIAAMFGPKHAYYASVCGRQDGQGGFDVMSVPDRKNLFLWYLDLARFSAMHDATKARITAVDVAGLEAKERSAADSEQDERHAASDLVDANMAVKIAEAAKKERFGEMQALSERRSESENVAKVDRLYDAAMKCESDLSRGEKELERLRGQEVKVPKQLDVDVAATRAKIEKATEALDVVRANNRKLEDLRTHLKTATSGLTRAKRAFSLVDDVPCHAEGDCASCQFLVDARAAGESLPSLEAEAEAAEVSVVEQEEGIEVLQASVEYTQEDIARFNREIVQASEVERFIAAAERAKAERDRSISVLEENVRGLDGRLEEIAEQIDELLSGLPLDGDGDVDRSAIVSIKDIDAAVLAYERADADLSAAVAKAHAAKTAAERTQERLVDARKALKAHRKAAEDLEPLRWFQRAVGPNGVQSMEIDAAGPEVSSIINDLLLACYGRRFQVEIRTLRKKKDGNYAEDFDFEIVDTEASESRGMGMISPGQRAMISEAIRLGLAMFQAKRRGQVSQAMFRDEPGSTLSTANAVKHMQMLHRAREVGSFRQVFAITHNDSAAEIADAIIEVADGKISVLGR